MTSDQIESVLDRYYEWAGGNLTQSEKLEREFAVEDHGLMDLLYGHMHLSVARERFAELVVARVPELAEGEPEVIEPDEDELLERLGRI